MTTSLRAAAAVIIASLAASTAVAQRRPRRPTPPVEAPAPPPQATPVTAVTASRAPSPAEAATPEAPAPEALVTHRARRTALEVSLALRGFTRTFTWTDDLFGELRPYTLAVAPSGQGSVEWYPAAHFTDTFLGDLGLTARAEGAFALVSRDSAGREYATSAWGLSVGARVRVPVGGVELGLLGSYGWSTYAVEASGGANDLGVPAVTYAFGRAGADLRARPAERWALAVSASWLFVQGTGDALPDAFPNSRAGGAEVTLAVTHALTDALELRLQLDARRFFHTLDPRPGDRWVAGGALDHQVGFGLGVGWRLPGV
ncbi:MAG: hypothetical protein HY909_22910 [Deltaproteobacteria bacterium]|nr:hypothetical protein [Deltaproteobacteria bacterium]